MGKPANLIIRDLKQRDHLREEGDYSFLINSNPATIMTDQVTADHIYLFTSLTVESLIKFWRTRYRRSFAYHGRTNCALNLAIEAENMGIWEAIWCQNDWC